MDTEPLDFLDTYEVEPNHIVGAENASWDGGMFETYGAEYDHVVKTFNEKPGHVWTVVEVLDNDDEDCFRVIHGLHHVNRFGYLISKQPCLPEHSALEFC